MGRPRSSNLISIALVLLLFGALQVDALASDLVGHVYMQTNESQNRIMHFGRNEDGQLELRESVPTGGAGSGVFKPISGQDSAPNAFEGAGSVILAQIQHPAVHDERRRQQCYELQSIQTAI